MKNTLRQLLGKSPLARRVAEARAAAEAAAVQAAESRRRLAETRAMLAAPPAPVDLSVLTDPANGPVLAEIRDYMSDLLDAVLAMHRTACESLDAIQAMSERHEP